jgi:uncharacterized membrane protein
MKPFLELDERFWKVLANVWTLVAMAFFMVDFFTYGRYDFLAGSLSAIYLAILGLFAGTKEYERWHGHHFSRYLGEYFVIFWTALIVAFIAVTLLTQRPYRLPTEFITVYISVLGIFALTQKSKNWYKNR